MKVTGVMNSTSKLSKAGFSKNPILSLASCFTCREIAASASTYYILKKTRVSYTRNISNNSVTDTQTDKKIDSWIERCIFNS